MKRWWPNIHLIVLAMSATLIKAQDTGQARDKYVLLTTPYNERQLTLYRGQLMVDAGYKFAVRSVSYDENGSRQLLTNNGSGSVYHYYYTDIRYGITDFVEIGAETNYIRHGIRTQTERYVSTSAAGTTDVTLNNIQEIRGMGDILLLLSLRPPLKFKWFDLSLTGGIFLPSSKYKPEMPSNTVTSAVANTFVINSYSRYANGYGVPVYLVSGAFKAVFRKFTFETDFTFRTPLKEGTSIRWTSTLENSKIAYTDKSYTYLASNEYNLNAALHYQVAGWLEVYLNGNGLKTKGGWTEYWGNKYANRETLLVNVEPSFEIQISPRLRICQVAGFPVSGKNSDASFYMFTSIRFSDFLR
ncbi:MAG TPA: hypothetical protein VMT63_02095 [Bacteroidales bacterium]|nr:hypothetical protein [Bacteroidales bacterium]